MSSRLYLFGYSGDDAHLNEIIQGAQTEEIFVIEWAGAGAVEERRADDNERQQYWERKTGRKCEIIRLENVLTFSSWRSSELKPLVSARAARAKKSTKESA